MSARWNTIQRAGTVLSVGSMLATPFFRRGGRVRRALTTGTVVGGTLRTFAVEARRDPGRAAATSAAIVAVTAAAEIAGSRGGRLFGRYGYTAALRPQVGGVPVLVPLAWYAMALPAHAAARSVLGGGSRPPARVGLGAGALTAWDLFLDPQMTAEGYWHWSSAGRYRGIPLRNFVGWFGLSVLVAALADAGRRDDRADAAQAASYLAVGALETTAFAVFWKDRLVALSGGLAMLPLGSAAVWRHGMLGRMGTGR